MKVTVFRTAMVGGGLSYDVLMRRERAPQHPKRNDTIIIRDEHGRRREWYDFVDATMPLDHYDMPLGWERYEHAKAHRADAERTALGIARQAFPELARYQGDSLPALWVTGLLPADEETHDSREVTV